MTKSFAELSGTFLVTGGTRGIGRAISIQFARAGACVIANYVRNEKAAQELKALVDNEQGRVELCRADLMNQESLKKIDSVIEQTGAPLRGFIHCAATGTHRPAVELTGRHLDWTLAVNVRAFFELVKTLLPRFADGSSVVAVSSLGGVRAISDYAAIGASKGALESLARHLAVELAPRGIRVNILVPGAIATEAWKSIPDGEARLALLASRTPLQRLVTAEEVARAAQFLCSSAATGINGHRLVVDGGASILL
jgi:enoyl-[acyl-carrier protein] reductase III